MTVLFSDEDVAAAVDAPLTVTAMRDVLLAAYEGTGAVRAIAVGEELGSRRTGGLGGVAVDALARPDAATLGVVGSGRQAWTQVWAAAAVRPLREVTVHSRSAARREAFAARVRAELGVPARAVGSATEAVRRRDVVVLATTSPAPVVDAADLAPGTHVNTVGFKQVHRHEFGPDLLDAAEVLVTDSPAQAAAYAPPMLAAIEPYAGRLRDLGAVLAGADRRGPDLGLLLHRPGRHRGLPARPAGPGRRHAPLSPPPGPAGAAPRNAAGRPFRVPGDRDMPRLARAGWPGTLGGCLPPSLPPTDVESRC